MASSSLSSAEREELSHAVISLVDAINLENEIEEELRKLLLVTAAIQLSGGGLSEVSLLAAVTKEFSMASAPHIRALSPTRFQILSCYVDLARCASLLALLDGRPYDALVILSTADRALGVTSPLCPSGSLHVRSTPSDGLLSGLSGDGRPRASRRISPPFPGSTTSTPSFTPLEHALVASAVHLYATPGRGVEVGSKPSAVGRAGGLNLRRGAQEVLSNVRRGSVGGIGLIVAGERLAALVSHTPLAGESGELSSRVWELFGHVSSCTGNLGAATVGYRLAGVEALPSLAATLLLSNKVNDALSLGSRCAKIMDGVYGGTGIGMGEADPTPSSSPPPPCDETEEEAFAAHTASLPYRLTCWVLGVAISSFYCETPFHPPKSLQSGSPPEFSSAADPWNHKWDAQRVFLEVVKTVSSSAAHHNPSQAVFSRAGPSLFFPHPLALASFTTSSLFSSSRTPTPSEVLSGSSEIIPAALLSHLLYPYDPSSPAAGAWLPAEFSRVALATLDLPSAPIAWAPASGISFLLRAAGATVSLSGGFAGSVNKIVFSPVRTRPVLEDAFSLHAIFLAAHAAMNSKPRTIPVLAQSYDVSFANERHRFHGSRLISVFSSGLEAGFTEEAKSSGDETEASTSKIPGDDPRARASVEATNLGWVGESGVEGEGGVELLRVLCDFFAEVGGLNASHSPIPSPLAHRSEDPNLFTLGGEMAHPDLGDSISSCSSALFSAAIHHALLSAASLFAHSASAPALRQTLVLAGSYLPAFSRGTFFSSALQAACTALANSDAALGLVGGREKSFAGGSPCSVSPQNSTGDSNTHSKNCISRINKELPTPTLNYWIPGRLKVLWSLYGGGSIDAQEKDPYALERQRVGNWAEAPPPPLLKAMRSIPPSQITPSPSVAALYTSPELLKGVLLKAAVDYPCLVRTMTKVTCGHGATRELLNKLQGTVDRSVDATLRLCSFFSGVDCQTASIFDTNKGEKAAGKDLYEELASAVYKGIGIVLDVVASAGEELLLPMLPTVCGGENPTENETTADPLWLFISGHLLETPSENAAWRGAETEQCMQTIKALSSATLFAALCLWRVHVQDEASLCVSAPLVGHQSTAGRTRPPLSLTTPPSLSSHQSRPPPASLVKSDGSILPLHYAACATVSCATARALTLGVGARLCGYRGLSVGGEGGGSSAGFSHASSSLARSAVQPYQQASINPLLSPPPFQNSLATLFFNSTASCPAAAARPMASLLTAEVEGSLFEEVSRSAISHARSQIYTAHPLRVQDPLSILPVALSPEHWVHAVTTAPVRQGGLLESSAPHLPPKLQSTGKYGVFEIENSLIPPAWRAIWPAVRRDFGFTDFFKTILLFLGAGVFHSSHTPLSPMAVSVISSSVGSSEMTMAPASSVQSDLPLVPHTPPPSSSTVKDRIFALIQSDVQIARASAAASSTAKEAATLKFKALRANEEVFFTSIQENDLPTMEVSQNRSPAAVNNNASGAGKSTPAATQPLVLRITAPTLSKGGGLGGHLKSKSEEPAPQPMRFSLALSSLLDCNPSDASDSSVHIVAASFAPPDEKTQSLPQEEIGSNFEIGELGNVDYSTINAASSLLQNRGISLLLAGSSVSEPPSSSQTPSVENSPAPLLVAHNIATLSPSYQAVHLPPLLPTVSQKAPLSADHLDLDEDGERIVGQTSSTRRFLEAARVLSHVAEESAAPPPLLIAGNDITIHSKHASTNTSTVDKRLFARAPLNSVPSTTSLSVGNGGAINSSFASTFSSSTHSSNFGDEDPRSSGYEKTLPLPPTLSQMKASLFPMAAPGSTKLGGVLLRTLSPEEGQRMLAQAQAQNMENSRDAALVASGGSPFLPPLPPPFSTDNLPHPSIAPYHSHNGSPLSTTLHHSTTTPTSKTNIIPIPLPNFSSLPRLGTQFPTGVSQPPMFPPVPLLKPPTAPLLAVHTTPLARAQAQFALLSAQTAALSAQADHLTGLYSMEDVPTEGIGVARGMALTELGNRAEHLLMSSTRILVEGSGPKPGQ